ncbi:MAG: flippase-like domain-containing protein [Candidatus Latescibacteria bacterium]|jgi:uncharacterized protein (TIRG00374 family)|nr:flippase-like domain-containing protein [Candidatus Latescibacterota bacterium]MBT4136781.1 flippase-like domain-containing protein [Candidatus Latescibacterota bacterium]MBT5830061.1 flippase-like domain-containing protein [Candidatus Latescibacterota bacterium]
MNLVRKIVFWGIGLALLGWLIHNVGIGSAWAQVRLMGWGYVPILLLALSWHLSNTWAWAFCFDPTQSRPSIWSLFRTKMSGEAVGNVTPASHVGGEVAKAYMLRGQVSVARGVPSLVVNKTIELVSGLAYSLVGACVAVWQFSLPFEVQVGLGGALLLGTIAIVTAFISQRQNTFVWLVNLLARFRLHFLESRRKQFEEMDRSIAAFYRQNRRGFGWCLGLHILSWILGTLEVYAILHLLGQPQPFVSAFLLMSLSLIINTAFFFIPSGVGVFESGHVFLFQLLGLSADLGLGVALIRRFRKIFWVTFGFVLMAIGRQKIVDPERMVEDTDSSIDTNSGAPT